MLRPTTHYFRCTNAFVLLGKVLHKHYDSIANEPLPRRWVELINYLVQKEKAEKETKAKPNLRQRS